MKTSFTAEQLADPDVRTSEAVLRKCVHCGFCTATCPTYILLGDELDSPRGRIYQIQNMLESDAAPSAETVKHVDRCLSCLSCMTTCPSGVHYGHLIDHARAHIEESFVRPWPERMLRKLLTAVLTRPRLFKAAVRFANLTRWAKPLAPGRLKTLVALAPSRLPASNLEPRRRLYPAEGVRRGRVAMLAGCVQPVLDPAIDAATIRLLTRHGIEVVVTAQSCCGGLPHHLGQRPRAEALAAAQIEAWSAEADLDAIILNASGCGATVKDYGHMFRDDVRLAAKAAHVSALASDISEYLLTLDLKPTGAAALRVAYHAACALQHGQGVREAPKALLRAAGFAVVEPKEPHICCGSAGAYNMLQPEIANQLRERKADNIAATAPDVVATGNIGCMTQLRPALAAPIVHTVELLDWATGGPIPATLAGRIES